MSKNVFHSSGRISGSSSNLSSTKQGSTVKNTLFSSSTMTRGKAAPTCNLFFVKINILLFLDTEMIKTVFLKLDINGDGFITIEDINTFKSSK
jgi:hypothetical protein